MKKHLFSLIALSVMILFAFGSVDSPTSTESPTPSEEEVPFSPRDDSPPPDVEADSPESPPQNTSTNERAKLIIESWHFSSEHGFVKATGQVTNNTTVSLQNVTAIVTYYTADGDFVKSDEAIISYNPILPGQTSPFETITTSNPAIAKASVSFKFLLGGSVPSITREDYEKPSPEELSAKRRAEEEAARIKAEEKARKAAALEAAKWKTWTSADGKFNVEAKFVKLANGIVTLEKKDGSTIDVKLDRFSSEDQEFVVKKKWRYEADSNEP